LTVIGQILTLTASSTTATAHCRRPLKVSLDINRKSA